MPCPKCKSDRLGIRQKTGMEAVIVLLTGLRKYHCLDCDNIFRAPDRRKRQRADATERAAAQLNASRR